MRLNAILLSLLPILSVASSFAATINVNAGANVASAVNSARSGDVVHLGEGTFTVTSPITIRSGVTLVGVSPASSHIVFNIAGTNDSLYGIKIAGNARDVVIEQLDIVSNHGLISMGMGTGYTAVEITHNNFQSGGGESSNGVLVFGISGTVPNDGLQITHNYFHDSPNCARNWTVFYATNANFDYNEFHNINDGGQIVFPGPNVSCSYNYGTHMHRMGQEVSLVTESTFTCTGNVFYDYVNPYFDTEGVSIVGDSDRVDITGNYFNANIAQGSSFGQADSGGTHRFGYCIECTGQPCNVTGNTIVGTWAECVSSDIAHANVSKNTLFGEGLWGDFEGEPGVFGYGSVDATNNSIHRNVSAAPKPPANTFAGPEWQTN